MPGERIVSMILDAAKNSVPNSEKTDLVYGRVISVNPLRIQVVNESKLVLPQSFLILSEMCKEKKVNINGTDVVLWEGLKVGNTVAMLRLLRGSKFYVLQKEEK